MALPIKKTPADFTFSHTGQPDQYGQSVGGDAGVVQTAFDSRAIDNQDFINSIIDALESIVNGSSGADSIGATAISGGTATTIQGILEELKILDSQNVKLNTIQNITGSKSFLDTVTVLNPAYANSATPKSYVDAIAAAFVLGTLPDNSVTNTKLATDIKVGSLATLTTTTKSSVVGAINEVDADLTTHIGHTTSDNVHGLDNTIAKFKSGSSTYTDNDTSQTFTDAFCTASSLVTIAITSVTKPQGVWTVTSGAGSFTITSTASESADITFDYYIQKAVA